MLEVVTAAPATDLTTITAVETEIGAMTSAQKTWAMAAIEAASALIEQEANQVFPQQAYTETIEGSGSSTLMLDRTPILGTPTIISTVNEVIVDFVVKDKLAGVLYRRQGWTQEISYQRGITYDPLGFETHPGFVISYNAGYHLPSFPDAVDPDAGEIELPANIERACVVTLKAWFHSKSRDSTVSWKQVGDLALGYRGDPAAKGTEPLRLPPEARALIKPRIF